MGQAPDGRCTAPDVWAIATLDLARSTPSATCFRQPELVATSTDAPVATTFAASRLPSSRAGSGFKTLLIPADPQQISGSAIYPSSRPGMPRSSA